MISDFELSMMKRQTKAFIEADVEEIQIEPRIMRVSDGAGGWVDGRGEPMPPVRVRLIPQSDRVPPVVVLEGSRPAPEFILVAMPDENIERYDEFLWRGRIWQISFIHDKPPYELKADVIIHAG